jgi:hypothetical protein
VNEFIDGEQARQPSDGHALCGLFFPSVSAVQACDKCSHRFVSAASLHLIVRTLALLALPAEEHIRSLEKGKAKRVSAKLICSSSWLEIQK